ncbi:hypothetical protein [Iningainema tapete]|uniref:Uncharacterized protein n=1 Tax=Iningainema tapete BLCC-T55 TaxID=2748662 RepID=A0A8J7CAG1_9CYAN|nr:hypothetical protein [Iningainema tapete]MBD2771390.1 hypothetical protein [Iningainema tapete BLCC-T55]
MNWKKVNKVGLQIMFLSQIKNLFSSLLITATASVFFLATASATKPIRVILDHDGAFEDFYALLVQGNALNHLPTL